MGSAAGSSSEPPEGSRRPARVEIDLQAIGRNLKQVRAATRSAVLALVKGDGYGHGAVPVAKRLEEGGVDWLGIAYVEEGPPLRQAGIGTPLLVLAPVEPRQVEVALRERLTPAVSSLDQLELWIAAASLSPEPPLAVHLKVDTGMHRLGLDPEELDEALGRLRRSRLELGGLISHLSESEALGSPVSEAQESSFAELVARLSPRERQRCLVHLANSAATLHRPASHHDLVRAGGAIYGVDLAAFVDPGRPKQVEPAMAVTTEIIATKQVATGERVGYGGRFEARGATRLAVVPVGYADGYSSRTSPGGEALVNGRRVPLAGAVSMDLTTLDVTGTEARVGDPVVLLGRQGEAEITAEELARTAGIGPYEVLCRFGLRLPRHYR